MEIYGRAQAVIVVLVLLLVSLLGVQACEIQGTDPLTERAASTQSAEQADRVPKPIAEGAASIQSKEQGGSTPSPQPPLPTKPTSMSAPTPPLSKPVSTDASAFSDESLLWFSTLRVGFYGEGKENLDLLGYSERSSLVSKPKGALSIGAFRWGGYRHQIRTLGYSIDRNSVLLELADDLPSDTKLILRLGDEQLPFSEGSINDNIIEWHHRLKWKVGDLVKVELTRAPAPEPTPTATVVVRPRSSVTLCMPRKTAFIEPDCGTEPWLCSKYPVLGSLSAVVEEVDEAIAAALEDSQSVSSVELEVPNVFVKVGFATEEDVMNAWDWLERYGGALGSSESRSYYMEIKDKTNLYVTVPAIFLLPLTRLDGFESIGWGRKDIEDEIYYRDVRPLHYDTVPVYKYLEWPPFLPEPAAYAPEFRPRMSKFEGMRRIQGVKRELDPETLTYVSVRLRTNERYTDGVIAWLRENGVSNNPSREGPHLYNISVSACQLRHLEKLEGVSEVLPPFG